MKRRDFVKLTLAGGAAALPFGGCETARTHGSPDAPDPELGNAIFHVSSVPSDPFSSGDHHLGLDTLVRLMGKNGLKFFRSRSAGSESGPNGLIAAGDVVLIKVNAQWKYRGCTNSDVVRGLIARILEHPDGFAGEVVIVENGQGSGSLACDTAAAYPDADVHANAQDESHSFLWLVGTHFRDPRVSATLLDGIRSRFINGADHATDGYRRYENVSYPCFTSKGGRRIELREGVWNGASHDSNLKLINVPVLKHHEGGASRFTGALKHVYGLLSMSDGNKDYRHYAGLGEACGKMMVSVQTPVLNIVDAIWVSQGSRTGYPASSTTRIDGLVASQDPVALDYWSAKHVLYPIDRNEHHDPDNEDIATWLSAARDTIVGRGGFNLKDKGIYVESPTKSESEMTIYQAAAGSIDL
jgi:uncharacterized protein (DUF362 family)